MPIVNVEGIGQVNFPDSMSNEQISDAIQKDILPQFPQIQAAQPRTWGEAATDIGASFGKGIGSLAQIPGQMYGLATGKMEPDTGLQGLGKQLENYSEELKSPVLRAREAVRSQKIGQAEGFLAEAGTAIGETIKDPALITSFFSEQIPNLFGAFGGGMATKIGMKVLMRDATEQALAKAGTYGARASEAAMQGADIGADTYEKIYDEAIKRGMDPKQAVETALLGGRKAAIEAAAITFGTSFGAGSTIERALTRSVAGAPKQSIIKGTLGELASESAEEGGGQLASNIEFQKVAPESDVMKGVGAAAGLGAIGGAAFGLPASFVTKANQLELERAKKLVEDAKRRAEETKQSQEVQLAIGYDPAVEGSGVYTPIIVNPDGTTVFPSERNKFAPSSTAELSTEGFNEKYGIPTEEELKARTFNADTIKSFGISPKANIYKNEDISGLDIGVPEKAAKVKAALDEYLKKYPNANPKIRKNIEEYLAKPEFQPAAPKPVPPPQITEASITPEADQEIIKKRLSEGFKNRPEIKKIYEEYDKIMQEKDADKAALSAFNSIVTPQTIKSLGFPTNSAIFADQELLNADLTDPETADKIRAKLMTFKDQTKSARVKENIDKYLNRGEFITPKYVDEYLNPPRTTEEKGLDHFVFTDSEGNIQSKYGTIQERGGKKYAKYAENKLQKGGERELSENVYINPTPDQIELATLYKSKEKLMKEPDDFKAWLMKHGVKPEERADMGIETRIPNKMFRNDGLPLDDLVMIAMEDGILHEPDFREGIGGVESMREYIRRAINGEFVPTMNNTRNMMDLENLQNRIDQIEEKIKGIPEEAVVEELKATEEAKKEATPKVEEAKEEKPPEEEPQAAKATMEQKKKAESVAQDFHGGEVAWQDGDLALIRVFSKFSKDPIYIPAKGTGYINKKIDQFEREVNIKDIKNTKLTQADIDILIKAKNNIEKANQKAEKEIIANFFKFNADGVAISKDIDPKLAGVINEWKKLFGLKNKIYVSTFEDAISNRDKFVGSYGRIASATFNKNENGVTQLLPNGERYILIKKSTSMSKMLEVLAHEMGHAHQQEVFDNASPQIKKQLKAEHEKWLESQKGKTAKELLHSLRSKKTAETTKVSDGLMADQLDSYETYWTSFSEWYADQVARWATTSEKPVSVIEQFFAKIANALRKIFSALKNKGYLPNETFKSYMDNITTPEAVKNNPIRPISTEDQQILFSKSSMKAEFDGLNEKENELLSKRFFKEEANVEQKLEGMREGFFEKMMIGLFDEFRAIKKYTTEGYMMARLSKSIDGALQGLLEYGHVYLKDGALDIRLGTKGLIEILKPLGVEVDRYQIWKALNRDAQMPADKRSFTDEEIKLRHKLIEGTLDGKSRKEVYEKARDEENQLNKSVLDIALQTGLIDKAAYQVFSNDIYYIPFYKQMEDGEVGAVNASSKLTGQYFSKGLKGGEKQVNDLMENVLLNWSHILSAAMKNQAAFKTVQAAESMGAAVRAKPMDGKFPPDTIKLMEDGKVVHFTLTDPDLVDAISTISYLGPKSAFLDVAKHFTNALRYGVTLSPAYKVRNLFRDSLQSASTSELGLNIMGNVVNGLKMSNKGNPTFMSALVGGGIFEMGVAHEGDQATMIKRLIKKGVNETTILDTPEKIKGKLQELLDAYNAVGNKFENANRLALFQKLKDSGKTHLEASFAARDLMDFSMQGQFRAVKMVGSVVPFFNARLQGLYKIGRDGITPTYRVICNATTGKPIDATDKQKAARFMTMATAVALASMTLYGIYKDDEDFQRREDWDRDNFWWFKIGETQYRIPKPFELGAFGTVAERVYEQVVDENVEGKVFGNRMNAILFDTFALNPMPQMFKPMIDLYSNKNSFTGAPIESAGMERLSKQERQTDKTSGIAKALGGITAGAHKVLTFNPDAEGFSPIQMDYAINAYFGWLGGTATSIADRAVEPFQEGTKVHPPIIDTLAQGFIKTEPQTQSKYMTQFYQNNARLQSALSDMRHYAQIGDEEKLNKVLEEKGDEIALAKVYDRATKQFAELRKQSRLIEQSKEISADDKRAEMNRIKILMSNIAKEMDSIRKSR